MEYSFISWLNNWQTIIGATIGGLMGFVGAWWVARSPIIKDEITAAQILIATILSIQVKTQSIDKLSLEQENEKIRKVKFIFQYLKKEPIPPVSFYSDIRILMPCNYDLAIRLTGLRILWQNIDNALLSIKEKINIFETSQEFQLTPYLEANIDTIYDGVHEISKQATDIMNLLENNVISKFRSVNNLMSWVKRNINKIIADCYF